MEEKFKNQDELESEANPDVETLESEVTEVEIPVDEQDANIAVDDADADEEASEVDPLSEALAKVEEFKDALQRERADFQNYKRRTEREKQTLQANISASVLGEILPIIDDFERALAAVPESEKDNDLLTGFNLILRKFKNLLDSRGVKEINPLGELFDPNFHEAIGTDEATEEFPDGHITVVLQKGYVKEDRVLRPAMVKVAN